MEESSATDEDESDCEEMNDDFFASTWNNVSQPLTRHITLFEHNKWTSQFIEIGVRTILRNIITEQA